MKKKKNIKKKSEEVIKFDVLKDEKPNFVKVTDSVKNPLFNQFDSVLQQNQALKFGTNNILHLTSSSNLLMEDESVLGVTINDSIKYKDYNIAGMTVESNILQQDDVIKINVPESLSLINKSIIDETSINALTIEPTNPILITPVDNIKDFSTDVLRLNKPIENSLSCLEIQQPSSLVSFEQPNDFLKVTTVDNLKLNECGSIRLTTDDNLFIRDGVDAFNTELTTKINSQSSIFKMQEDNKLYLDTGVVNDSLLYGPQFNPVLDKTKSLLSTFELGKIGKPLEISIEESSALQNRFLGLTDSYSDLFKLMADKELFINTLPETIALHTPYEYYRDTKLISIVSNEPDTVEIEDDYFETELHDELNGYLSDINPGMTKMLEGAKVALKSKNPDRIRHFSTSLRELFTYVIHHLSPNDEINKWSKDPSHYVNKKPTRKARLLYICQGINHDSFTDFIKSDIDSVLSFINLFQVGTHSIESKLTDNQLNTMLLRMESTLSYLIKIGKFK